MYNEQIGPIRENVMQNNNIATRNTSLVPLSGHIIGPVPNGNFTLFTRNFYSHAETFDIELRNTREMSNFVAKGNVILTLDSELWDAWVSGGSELQGMLVWDAAQHQLQVTDNLVAYLKNVTLGALERREMAVSFYLNEEVSTEEHYQFALSQKLSSGSEAVGSSCMFDVSINDASISNERRANATSSQIPSLSVSPNPYEYSFTVNYQLNEEAMVNIELWDNMGRKISTLMHETQAKGEYSQVFEPQLLQSGIYYLVFKTGESQSVKKLIHIQN